MYFKIKKFGLEKPNFLGKSKTENPRVKKTHGGWKRNHKKKKNYWNGHLFYPDKLNLLASFDGFSSFYE
jgi:hypothetical protein